MNPRGIEKENVEYREKLQPMSRKEVVVKNSKK